MGLHCFGGMPCALHDALHDAERVVLVVDREAGRPADETRGAAEHARADGVERAAPHARGLLAEQARDALAHLAGGLVGERDGENPRRVDAVMLDQARDARGEHAGLSGARAGEHEQRAVDVQHRFALRGVESG